MLNSSQDYYFALNFYQNENNDFNKPACNI
jgi:hypothetical protein